MSVLPRLVAAAAVAGSCGALVVPAHAAARHPSCATAAGATLAASASVRVYATGPSNDRTVSSCWLRTARRTLVGRSLELGDNKQELDFLSVAGRYVASRQAISTGSDLTVDVQLTDARSGRTVRTPVASSEDVVSNGVTAVVASSAGNAVWAGPAADCEGLHVLRASGPSTLACGAVSEVALSGLRAYWQQDGQTRTALLPGG